jgi:hypothetical protein
VIDSGIFSLLGMISVIIAMIVLGLLSKRIGAVTHSPRYYIGLYVAAALMGISVLGRLVNWLQRVDPNGDPGWILLYIGLPTVAVTIALISAWRYWSWLLAERG